MTLCDSTMPLKNSVAVACTALLLAALALPAAGSGWTTADNPEHLCGKLSLCTASNFTWPVAAVFDKDLGCALLARKGLENLLIAGDSFMRHIYVGMVLTLTGNYQNGALMEGVLDCDHNKQFDEKRCRTLLESPKSVCGGVVTLRHLNGNPSLGDVCEAPVPGNLTLWSIGSHQLTYERKDIVVTTHQRLNHRTFHPTLENHTTIRRYNEGMRNYFEAGHCGPAHVVDVFNMTHALVTELEEEAEPLTYDSVHWAEVVNLIKAQILLNDIEAYLPDVDTQAPARRMLDAQPWFSVPG